jgi:hypothetical protein
MRFQGSGTVTILLLAGLLFVCSATAQAEIKPGVRAASYFDPSNAAIGGEILMNLNDEETLFFNPNVEYVFLDPADLWTINFDFHYDLLSARQPIYFWVGGGPAILIRDPDNPRLNEDTDFGVNLLAGIGFKIRGTSIIPYIQPKYTITDNDRFSIAFGVRF